MKKHPASSQKFSTLLVHAGEAPDETTGAIAPVLVRTKTFAQKTFGVEATYQYSRGKHPTRDKLEEKLATLEGGGQAVLFGSGLAAETAFLLTLSPEDHVLCCEEVYGGTFRLLDGLLSRFGITASYVNFNFEEDIRKSIQSNTKWLWVETPTNPSLHIVDLALVSKVSRDTKIPFVVDGTFAPPCTTRPFEYGAHTVIHSLSKYIAGHNDVLGGAVITKDKSLYEQMGFMLKTVGAVLSPDEVYRVLQGVKTLQMRWEWVSESALRVAKFLAESNKVKRALYPGLPSHPGHAIAKRQMQNGYGGVLSFELTETRLEKLKLFVDVARAEGPIVYAESLASPETILAYPPLMSHKSLPSDVRLSLGIGDSFFRLSLGFEDAGDVIAGLSYALATI